MYVLTMAKAQGFLVVPDKETEALVLDRLKHSGKVLKAGVRYVVKPGNVLWINGLEVKPLVLKVDALSVVAHAEPESATIGANGVNGGAESIYVARSGSEVDVPNRVEPE